LFGSNGDNLLIGSYTAFDNNRAALQAIMQEWSSSNDYLTRVANLTGVGTGPRSNGNFFLIASGSGRTVFDDGDRDEMTGSSGRDWFFAALNDVLKDRSSDERLDLLS